VAKLLDDPEMKYFVSQLLRTPAGQRYSRSWNAMRRALKEIYRLEGLNGALCRSQRAAYRKMYHDASESASLALSSLAMLHNWPQNSLADGDYIYLPPARPSPRKRQKRRPPV
jgi:hypothetical protein